MVMVPSEILHCITSGCLTNNETMSAKYILTYTSTSHTFLNNVSCSHEIKVGSLFCTELHIAALT